MPNPRANKPLTLEQVKNDLQNSKKSPTGGAAFGIYPMIGKRREDRQDREAAKSFPVDLSRGVAAGFFGMPADFLNLPGDVYSAVTDNELYKVPYGSADILKRLPFGTDTPAGRFASDIGTIAGGSANVGSVIRGAKALPSALKTAARNLSAPRTLNPEAGVIKVKGGNWLAGSVERDLKPLRRLVSSENLGNYTPEQVEQLTASGRLATSDALNNWADRNLGNYIKKEMGTPEDPVRRLAEEGITHKQNLADYEGIYPDRTLMDQRKAAGFPEEGLGQSPLAKAWERASDESIAPYNAGDIQAAPEQAARLEAAKERMTSARDALDSKVFEHIVSKGLSENDATNLVKGLPFDQKAAMVGDTDFLQANSEFLALHSPMTESFLKMNKENPWIAKVDPNTSVYSPFSGDLGFDHIMDVLREDVTSGRIRPEQLSKVSMEQAVRRTYEYDQELAKKMAEAKATAREGLPVYKDYPEGYRWVELNKPGSFASESEAMGHSVRGYEPPKGHPDWVEGSGGAGSLGYGHGGWEAIKSGKAKVYSLVDSKGQPHTTVEVGRQKPQRFYDLPEDIRDELTDVAYDKIRAVDDAKIWNPDESMSYYGDQKFQEIREDLMRDWLKQNASSLPQVITQIKGKGNAAPKEDYLPYVQDFVKSGKWSDVGDLQNTGLVNVSGKYFTEPELTEASKKYGRMGVMDTDWETARQRHIDAGVPEDEALRNWVEGFKEGRGRLDIPPEEGMARGGRVHFSDNPDVMALELAGGGLVKRGIKAASQAIKGTQDVLPAAEREANKAKFLEGSKTPMRLYHGTTATEGGKGQEAIRRIKPSKDGALGSGVYLTPNSAHASGYSGIPNDEALAVMASDPYAKRMADQFMADRASGTLRKGQEGGNMLPVTARLRNPLILEGKGDPMIEALVKLGMDENSASKMVERAYEQKGYIGKQVQQRAQAAGYDGLMQYRDGELSEVVSYNPNAVKSDIGNRGTYDMNDPDLNKAKGGSVHFSNNPDVMMLELARGGAVRMQSGGSPSKRAIGAGAKAIKALKDAFAPKGVDPIIVRTPEEQAVIDKFGQKQQQEAERQKKVEKAAKESAGRSPEESAKPTKSTGKRVAVPPDVYRKMAEEQGDEAVLRAARAGKHLKPAGKGFIGAPRTVKGKRGLNTMRSEIDQDFIDSVDAVRLADPQRLGTWYDRAKQGIAESVEPYQLPRTLEQHGVYSAGVSPESELTFALKHLNSRVAGDPKMAYRGAGMENLDEAVAENRPASMGFKIGEYAEKNDPRVPNAGLFGVNDFRRAQGMGYTDPEGNPWKAGVSDTMHPFMDAETALQVDRANAAGTGGRTDWAGPQIQEVPWVYGKAQDQYGRGKGGGRYAGDELEGIKQSLVDANNTARDYMYKHTASATHEAIPGAGLNHVPQALDMTPEEKLAYGQTGRWDLPSPEAALNEFPEVGAGNRDILYGAAGYRQLPSREAEGLYVNSLGGVENNPMTIARPLMDFPTGGGGLMAPDSRATMDFIEHFRPFMDAQEAGAYNLPNTMNAVQGKNSMLLDTRGLSSDPLADPTAGVLPTAKQLGEINSALSEASGAAKKEAKELREKLPFGPPTKANVNKLQGLEDAASGYGVTSTNRGALVFPYNAETSSAGIKDLMKRAGPAIENVFPGAKQERSLSTMGYQPGIGKRSPEGPLPTAPFSGEATADLLRHASELPQSVLENLSESEWIRNQIREKALRDAKMGGTRKDIQESRRFFSEADWPKAVAMIRKGMTPAAALAALGYNINAMAAEEQ